MRGAGETLLNRVHNSDHQRWVTAHQQALRLCPKIGVGQHDHVNMNGERHRPQGHDWQAGQVSPERLAALSRVTFCDQDTGQIFQMAAVAVGELASCHVVASYLCSDGSYARVQPSQPEHPEIERHLRESGCGGQVEVPGGRWVWPLPLSHRNVVKGCLVLDAVVAPPADQIILLTILGQQAGAALAYAALQDRAIGHAGQLKEASSYLEETNHELAEVVSQLRTHTAIHEVLTKAAVAGRGEQGITDALYDLTALPVGVEDRFGNLRCWTGPEQPNPYPKRTADERELLLHELATWNGPTRIEGRVLTLVQSGAQVLGVLALWDPDGTVTEDGLFALRYGATVLALELSHRRKLAEMELKLRRDLVDDLVAGTDREGAYARADALGHDLRRPHYVVLVRVAGHIEHSLATAAGHAATALHLKYLQGRQKGLIVLLADGRPDPGALHHALSDGLDRTKCVIGIGSRCEVPDDFPRSFIEARRALNIRLRSANPEGAAAFDELGFYRLIDAAHNGGAVEAFVREWLGPLLDYDDSKNSELVLTLSDYLECGGNYDESAATLHIHRSTLRYRLTRIAELTGHDLRKVDTRFNLHAATRAWRFLKAEG